MYMGKYEALDISAKTDVATKRLADILLDGLFQDNSQ